MELLFISTLLDLYTCCSFVSRIENGCCTTIVGFASTSYLVQEQRVFPFLKIYYTCNAFKLIINYGVVDISRIFIRRYYGKLPLICFFYESRMCNKNLMTENSFLLVNVLV